MKKYLIAGLAVVLLAALVFSSLSRETPSDFIEMEVKGLRFDAFGQSPVIVLADKDQKKALPIWIGIPEAGAIERELNQVTPPRPMTHDLLHSVLTRIQAKVKEIRILDLRDHTYFAKVVLTVNEELLEIDARPSDAIIIAMKSKSPIFVSVKILNDQGISVTRNSAFGERYGIRIQELTPSLASHFNFKGNKGVLVSEVLPGNALEASAIKAGDIITKIDRKDVGDVHEFEEILDAMKGGLSVTITLFRDDTLQEVNLDLKP